MGLNFAPESWLSERMRGVVGYEDLKALVGLVRDKLHNGNVDSAKQYFESYKSDKLKMSKGPGVFPDIYDSKMKKIIDKNNLDWKI